jgi:hypothetical protein
MARVQISDEVWAAYRASLGPTPVSVALGELVRREVGRSSRRSAGDLEGVRVALDDARQRSDELASLIARLERAGSSITPSGALESASRRERPLWPDDIR